MDLSLLSSSERLEIELSILYSKEGYVRTKLSQFDEYELFDRHRAFLSGERMLTFTDPHGKLFALRPDVTLSVLKQAAYMPMDSVRVYYKEDVFRMSKETRSFESSRQIGVERIEKSVPSSGKQILSLAQKSLSLIPADTVLVLSHMDLFDKNEWFHSLSAQDQDQVLFLMGQKNAHDLKQLLEAKGCPELMEGQILYALNLTGSPEEIREQAAMLPEDLMISSCCRRVLELADQIPSDEHHRIVIDFSLVNSLNYYNGLIFQGFAEGCSHYVLSGGRYDRLAAEFISDRDKNCGAIGFAISMDELEPVWKERS